MQTTYPQNYPQLSSAHLPVPNYPSNCLPMPAPDLISPHATNHPHYLPHRQTTAPSRDYPQKQKKNVIFWCEVRFLEINPRLTSHPNQFPHFNSPSPILIPANWPDRKDVATCSQKPPSTAPLLTPPLICKKRAKNTELKYQF